MTTLTDEDLQLHAEALKGNVALITGGANGVGRVRQFLLYLLGANCLIDRRRPCDRQTDEILIDDGNFVGAAWSKRNHR